MSYEIYSLFIWAWIGLAVVVFFALLHITAPYGRHTKSSWGPMIGNKTGWIIMEGFVVVVLFYFVFRGKSVQSVANYVILSLFTFHYLNRSLVFPFRLKTKGKKMPLAIMLMGMIFNLVNGFIIGYYLGNFKVYEIGWLASSLFIIGIVIFILGMAVNWHSDTILINLRRGGESGYKIPQGGLFKYVSCPNLLGEIIEWAGFAIMMWCLPGLAFFTWTFANLVPRAFAHHRWYLKTFADYPKDRKAIFPFL